MYDLESESFLKSPAEITKKKNRTEEDDDTGEQPKERPHDRIKSATEKERYYGVVWLVY